MNEPEKKRRKSIGRIEKVDSSQMVPMPESQWIPVLKAFNPIGAIAEAYARTLAYKIETKRLDIELTRVNRQAEIAHNIIDKTFKLKMEELQHRRIALVGFYQTVNAEFERLHIEREEVLKMAQLAQAKSFESGLPLEERQMYKEMTIEITRELPRFGEKSNESLNSLVEALPAVKISSRLLAEV